MISELKIDFTKAFLALALFALNSTSFAASPPTLKDIITKPGVAEQMQSNYGGKTTYDGQQDTPLVIQARKFALRINPPPPPEPVHKQSENRPIRPQAEIAPQFKLIATSYHFSDQKQSWALIDEVGKGLHWVRQGSVVGHLNIQKVGDGGVLIDDNGKKYELLADRQSKPELVKSYTGKLDKPEPIVLLEPGQKASQTTESTPSAQDVTGTDAPQEPATQELTPEEQLQQTQSSIEWLKQMTSKDPNSAGMSAAEANELNGFGEILKTLEAEAQQLQAKTVSGPNKPDKNNLQPKADANAPKSPPASPGIVEHKPSTVSSAGGDSSQTQQPLKSRRIRQRK
jgi:hypothetical protein